MPRRLVIIYTLCFVFLNLPTSASIAKGPISGNTYAVEVTGSLAYIGVGQHLIVFNVADPRNPLQVGKVAALGDAVQDIQVVGNLAYIAAGTTGLHIIDVSNPGRPLKISHYDTPGFVHGVFVTGDYAYLAAGVAGLLLMNVSDPAKPTPVAISKTLGQDRDVSVSGGIAYVASDEDGVRVVDVTDPTTPFNIGSIRTPNDANDVFVDGDLIYIAAGSGGLQIVDIRNPSDPKEVAVEDTGYTRRVIVESGFAYAATERKGVWALDVTNPTTPRRVKRFTPEGSANSMDVEGDYLYVADGMGGLLVIECSRSRVMEINRHFLSASDG